MSTAPANVFDTNKVRLAPLLATLRKVGIGHWIGGKRAESADNRTFETCSPVDLTRIAEGARGSATDIDWAAQAAKAVFPAWRTMMRGMRQRLLHRVADLIETHAENIGVLESWDTGQPIRIMAKAALRGAENFRFFADRCVRARDGLNRPADEHWNMTTRVPLGPVGVITPWNTPFMLSTWKIAPALAAGCTVVYKPAEAAPRLPALGAMAAIGRLIFIWKPSQSIWLKAPTQFHDWECKPCPYQSKHLSHRLILYDAVTLYLGCKTLLVAPFSTQTSSTCIRKAKVQTRCFCAAWKIYNMTH